LSPDWSAKYEPIPYAKLDDPQTLNLYSYVQNNPLTRVDADGHCDLCWNLISRVSIYIATHPDLSKAVEKFTDSLGIKASAGLGRRVSIGPVNVGAALTVTSEARNDGTGSSSVQATAAATVNGVGGQANGTATFEKNGTLVNPLNNLSGNAKATASIPTSNVSNANAVVGADGRLAVGPAVNVGVAQVGVQVTAGIEESKGVLSGLGDSIAQDVRQTISDMKESLTCDVGGCAR
jgi:hypothetical protein